MGTNLTNVDILLSDLGTTRSPGIMGSPFKERSTNIAANAEWSSGSSQSQSQDSFDLSFRENGSPFTSSPFGMGVFSPYKRRLGSESPVVRSTIFETGYHSPFFSALGFGSSKSKEDSKDLSLVGATPVRLSRKVFGASSPLTPASCVDGAKRKRDVDDDQSSPTRPPPAKKRPPPPVFRRERSLRIRSRALSASSTAASTKVDPLDVDTVEKESEPSSQSQSHSQSQTTSSPSPEPESPTMRNLPHGTEVHEGFWRWYTTFPLILTGGRGGNGAVRNANVAAGAAAAIGRRRDSGENNGGEGGGEGGCGISPDDMYTPRWVKGKGASKMGLCPICGEAGKSRWFAMKFSAYNYHMQYAHGISATTARPFDPPLRVRVGPPSASSSQQAAASSSQPDATGPSPSSSQLASQSSGSQSRTMSSFGSQSKSQSSSQTATSSFASSTSESPESDRKNSKRPNLKPEHEKLHGLCGQCGQWIAVEGMKDAPLKVPEMVWWKHARGHGHTKGKGK